MNGSPKTKVLASFRDPSGFIFKKEGEYFRQVNQTYKENYDLLIKSGLFDELVKLGLLVNHQEVVSSKIDASIYKILKPTQIPFISYPYEWSFSQLKDAALLTLEIQNIALKFGMSLKDASAYNIQFLRGKPILIDTLSFEKYENGRPWVAYRQFCQHFLAPLALASHTDLRLGLLSQTHLDGIPLDLAAKILPGKTRFSLGLSTHIFLHAKSQISHADGTQETAGLKLPKNQLIGIVDNLKAAVLGLKLPRQRTTWDNYYGNTNYSEAGFKNKEKIISDWIKKVKPKTLWDAGANDGHFSRLSSGQKIRTLSTDFDPIAVENNYLKMKSDNDQCLFPLIIDLVNPSPSIGWQNEERNSFTERNYSDLTLCLALVHHLAISNNLPLGYIAEFFNRQTKFLIIEFVPKDDSNAQKLLANRKNIFASYDQKSFEKEFSVYFKIIEQAKIKDSNRTLYLMERSN